MFGDCGEACVLACSAESGLLGTSDSFAAAVWTADLSFEFAAAGATGIHFHWSFGSTPYSGRRKEGENKKRVWRYNLNM
jgi:hypothetical protein